LFDPLEIDRDVNLVADVGDIGLHAELGTTERRCCEEHRPLQRLVAGGEARAKNSASGGRLAMSSV
jgi:hypothetical protein